MKFIMPLVVLAFVVAGFAYYTLFTGPNTATLPAPDRVEQLAPPADPVDPNERTAFSGESSLASLLARGDSIECAITHIPNPLEAEITGNIFTNVGQLRGDLSCRPLTWRGKWSLPLLLQRTLSGNGQILTAN
jgi:hypothetical protein